MTVVTVCRRVFAIAAMATLPALSFAAGPTNLDAKGVAIHGYDPVAYFVDGKAMQGRAELSATMDGATYWFANESNQRAFKADPARYEPQFGGYCAFGVSQGYKPDVDPTAFKIVDGKLYLNLSPAVQKRWQEDIPGFVSQATQNWPALKSK